MRTTLNLDDDIFLVARSAAQRENISLGELISRLVRQGMQMQNQKAPIRGKTKSRFALIPARDETITLDHVRQLMDQEGI